MKNRLRLAALAVAAAAPLSIASAGMAHASGYGSYPSPGYGYDTEKTGVEGCTPGYWKNHTESWARYSPTQSLSSVFPAATSRVGKATLLDALQFKGGNGVDGASRNLLRAAVAAVLNAAHSEVDYAFTSVQVLKDVEAALRKGDRAAILALASKLDKANNGGCTL